MHRPDTRRHFLRTTSAAGAVLLSGGAPAPAAPERGKGIKVVVWDERQPAQKQAYEHFLGNAIADHLRAQPGLSVRSVALDDPGQGLGGDVLDDCDVLIWWGHVRQAEVAPETGKKIVARVKAGTLALVALHSAHWSAPFVEAMNERTRLDVARKFGAGGDAVEITEVSPPKRYTVPKADERVTPYVVERRFPDGRVKVAVHLPYCCFPSYRGDGKPSRVRVLRPDHPIADGLPRQFELPRTEMYDEPFHVPEPDEVVLEERWAGGEWFRSGMVWNLGAGRVFYFRPGHETYPIYREALPLKVLTNAVRWLAPGAAAS